MSYLIRYGFRDGIPVKRHTGLYWTLTFSPTNVPAAEMVVVTVTDETFCSLDRGRLYTVEEIDALAAPKEAKPFGGYPIPGSRDRNQKGL